MTSLSASKLKNSYYQSVWECEISSLLTKSDVIVKFGLFLNFLYTTDFPYGRPPDPNLTYPYDIRYFENLFQDFLSGQRNAIPPSVLISGLVGANRNQFNESDSF